MKSNVTFSYFDELNQRIIKNRCLNLNIDDDKSEKKEQVIHINHQEVNRNSIHSQESLDENYE